MDSNVFPICSPSNPLCGFPHLCIVIRRIHVTHSVKAVLQDPWQHSWRFHSNTRNFRNLNFFKNNNPPTYPTQPTVTYLSTVELGCDSWAGLDKLGKCVLLCCNATTMTTQGVLPQVQGNCKTAP